MPPYDLQVEMLDKFLKAAKDQVGDRYRFGAEASDADANPTSFDSSELVEWAAHRAGYHDMPDGSVEQYRFLERQGATVKVDEALHTPGALVFGFSADPRDATRPARAYVAISVGDGKNVIDVSERAGEVKVMPAGDFYNYGAKIPEFHGLPDSIGIDTDGDGIPDASLRRPFPPGEIDTDGDGIPDSSVPDPADATDPIDWGEQRRRGIKMDGRTTEPGPAATAPADDDPVIPAAPAQSAPPQSGSIDDPGDADPVASYADEPLPQDQLGYPDDDGGGLGAQPEPAPTPAPTPAAETTAYADASDFAGTSAAGDADYGDYGDYGDPTYSDNYADSSTDVSADA